VILDLLPASVSVVVGRMRLEDVALHSITERGLYATTNFNTLYRIDRYMLFIALTVNDCHLCILSVIGVYQVIVGT